MSLYKAETRRLVKRRFTRYLTLAGLLVLAAVAVGMFLTNEKVSPAVVANAQQQAEADYRQQLGFVEQERRTCEAAKGTPQAANYPADCAEITGPRREDIQVEWFMPPTFDFRGEFGDMITTLAAILAMVAFVVGASFVGAEWSSGGMMNLLLWRPQRLKVLGTKLAVLVVGLTGLTVAVSAVWTAAFWVIAALRGTTERMTSGVWQSFALTGLRGLTLILVAGIVGFGLASLGRHTAMALGVAIGVGVVLQFGLGAVLSMAQVKFFEAYLIPVWAMAWMQKKVELSDYNACNFSTSGGCLPDTLSITWQMSGGALIAVVALVMGAAMWTLRNRDIT